jgi:tetratricopeptide (TPR) repeat protein
MNESVRNALLRTAHIEVSGGRPERALEIYDRLVRDGPRDVGVENARGVLLKQLGRLDDAIAAHQATLLHSPDDAATHNNLGVLWKSRANLDAALAAYRRALAAQPDFVIAQRNLAIGKRLVVQFRAVLDLTVAARTPTNSLRTPTKKHEPDST